MATTQTIMEKADRRESLISKMLNVYVTPGEVFDEIIANPMRQTTWLVPMAVVILAGLFLLTATNALHDPRTSAKDIMDTTPVLPTEALTRHWLPVSMLILCGAVVTGTFWSALIIWGIGRLFLKVSFSFGKTLAVVGLTGVILALGNVVTGLFVLATGNGAIEPAAASFLPKAASGVLNVFHLWSTAVLAIGLARLAAVSVKEALFWVFAYWVILRVGLVLLA